MGPAPIIISGVNVGSMLTPTPPGVRLRWVERYVFFVVQARFAPVQASGNFFTGRIAMDDRAEEFQHCLLRGFVTVLLQATLTLFRENANIAAAYRLGASPLFARKFRAPFRAFQSLLPQEHMKENDS